MNTDICFCINKDCDKFKDCYRGSGKPNPHWQAYSDFNFERDKCFIPIDNKKKKRLTKVDNK